MKTRNLLLAMALMPALAFAQNNIPQTTDTTFVVNDKKIAVSQDGEKTTVAVYNADGTQMRKMSETQFVDGQEVERVYVTSPFVPKTFNKHRSLQYSHYPLIFGGFSSLASSPFKTSGNSLTDDASSAEWGITGLSFAFPLSGSLAITSSCSLGQMRHEFNTNNILSTVDGVTNLRPFVGENEGDHLKKSYLIYWDVRFPVMLEWSRRFGGDDAFFAIGPSLEYRFNARSRYKLGKKKHTVTKQTNINPVGVNLEARLGYGCMLLYARTALTPLLKKSCAPEWYPFSVGIGMRM